MDVTGQRTGWSRHLCRNATAQRSPAAVFFFKGMMVKKGVEEERFPAWRMPARRESIDARGLGFRGIGQGVPCEDRRKAILRAMTEDRPASWTRLGLGYPSSGCSSAEPDSISPSAVILSDGDQLGIPGSIFLEQGVEDHHELAHAGNETDLFALGVSMRLRSPQTFVELLDNAVAARGG